MRLAQYRLLASPSSLKRLQEIYHGKGPPSCRWSSIQHTGNGDREAQDYDVGTPDGHLRGIPGRPTTGQTSVIETRGGSREAKRRHKQSMISGHDIPQDDLDFRFTMGRNLLARDSGGSINWNMWLDAMRYQQRHQGHYGTKLVWERILRKRLDIPTEGAIAQELWDRIVASALAGQITMDDLLSYGLGLGHRTGKEPPLYRRIMVTQLGAAATDALSWHLKLKTQFSPGVRDYHELFKQCLRLETLSVFESIYRDLPLRPLYEIIIPKLTELRLYEKALHWHSILLQAKDMPYHFSTFEPLLTHLAQIGDDKRLERVVMSLQAAKMRAKLPSKVELQLNKFIRSKEQETMSREMMNRQLGEIHGIVPKRLSDSFCARLFATKLFRVDTVINGLVMMGAENIGPNSLREIVIRNDFSGAGICRHLDRLKGAGIAIGNSKYATLIRQAAIGNRTSLLHSIIECDAHPDTYEDFNLQEKLFTMYLGQRDRPQVMRVMASMTSEVPQPALEMQKLNLYLRGHIRLGERERVLHILEQMKAREIPLTPKSSRHIRVLWLSRRKVGKTGYASRTLKDVTLVTNVMRQTLEAGGYVPLDAWKEILRRLGMTGKLQECRDLALWLAQWYGNMPKAADTGRSLEYSLKRISASRQNMSRTPALVDGSSPPHLPSNPPQPEGIATRAVPASLTTLADKLTTADGQHHHLKRLFTRAAQQAIITWGFQQEAKRPTGTDKESWTWGLRLLRQLRDHGVPISQREVAHVCKQRLAQLFSVKTKSKRPVNMTARRLNNRRIAEGVAQAQYGSYVRRMEELWGSDLFIEGGYMKKSISSPEMHGSDQRGRWRIRTLPVCNTN